MPEPQQGWSIGVAPTPTLEERKRKPQAWTVGKAPTVQQAAPSTVSPSVPVAKPPVPPPVGPPGKTPTGFPKGSMESTSPLTAGFLKGGMLADPSRLDEVTSVNVGKKLVPVEHPIARMTARAVGDAAKGIGDWMDKVGKQPLHVTDPVIVPLDNLARMLEFHTGSKYDVFGLKKAGIDETVLEEMARGLSKGDTDVIENAAGKFLGGIFTVKTLAKSPELARAIKDLPGKLADVSEDVKAARNKSVITAAANNTLDHDAKNVIVPTVVQAVKNTNEVVGRRVKTIADADRTASAASGSSGAFTRASLAQDVADAVTQTRATNVAKPGVTQVVKALRRYGNDMSWEDLKDARGALDAAFADASGKDRAVLGKVREAWTSKLAARAAALGKADEFKDYVEISRKINEHKRGIISEMQNADTGLKLYQTLTKASNKPQLNDLFGLLEKHGGVPSGFVDDLVSSRKPIFDFAKRTDGSDMAGGRMSAIMRHPLAAGTAMIGTGGAVSTLSPIPMTGSFVASLVAAQKTAEFMDRYDAAKAIRKIRGASPPAPRVTPFPGPGAPPSTPQGATPAGGGPGTLPPPVGPGAPPTPSGPTASPAVSATPPVATPPVGTGAPAPPASLDDFMSRVSDAAKRQQVARETTPVAEKPLKVEAPAKASAPAKPAPYEAFGVKIDKSTLTTPEAVRAAKLDGERQIEEIGRAKYTEISKLPTGEARSAALKQLDADVREASRSVSKMQTPEVSRKARDRVRKAAEPTAKPMEKAELENLPAATPPGAEAVTSQEDAMMRGIDLQLEAERAGPTVHAVYNKILEKFGGDSQAALPMLESLMEQVRKAKKPASE